jgi:hypothetical protein
MASRLAWCAVRTCSTSWAEKLYTLKGVNIYRPSGELAGHLSGAKGSEKRLDRCTDRLFPAKRNS